MKFCTVCGAELTDGALCCANCGATVQAAAAPAPKQDSCGKAMAIVSFICGIIGVISLSGISLGVIATVFGIVSKKEGYKGSMATAGTVLGIVSLVMYVLFIVAYIIFIVAYILMIILGISAIGMESMYYF